MQKTKGNSRGWSTLVTPRQNATALTAQLYLSRNYRPVSLNLPTCKSLAPPPPKHKRETKKKKNVKKEKNEPIK